MRSGIAAAFGFLCLLITADTAVAQQAQPDTNDVITRLKALHWIRSPQIFSVASVANVTLPTNMKALNQADTSQFLQIMGNPPDAHEYAISTEDFSWFSIFSFNPDGYVKDDEKIDPDDLLRTLRSQNIINIDERKKSGLTALYLDGWYVEPHYDVQSHRLEWGTKLHDEQNTPIINYTSRILGRTGVMNTILVSAPENFATDLPAFHALLNRFSFDQGEKYTEFRQGDKVAAYGLGALVVGGAAAVAVKAGGGALKGLAYAAFAAIAGFFAWVKSLFTRRKKP